ncbi:ATP-binding cassette domain-containing protein [Falsihalocynthiibacter sp. SS001]|uniref:ATP-binding cassette domain-containing protein n=1 Tax=Falsihalocynthiibacter sp. SS001 TaxID=3349698 RepID=UPI0036D4139A
MIDLDITIERSGYRLDAAMMIEDQYVTGLVGPSGSGKTSILRALAGLEQPTSGTIKFGEHVWFDSKAKINVPATKRRVGFVFQNIRLFPHLSVAGNLALAAKWGRSAGLSDAMVSALELTNLLKRMPSTLSGGEARRVALARALAQSPQLLLLDEPLSGLDPAQKERILPAVARAIELANIPALFVSHEPDDVQKLCEAQYKIQGEARQYATALSASYGNYVSVQVTDKAPQISVKVDQTELKLPADLLCEHLPERGAMNLYFDANSAFISGPDTIAPQGFVALPFSIDEVGSIRCGGHKLELITLEKQLVEARHPAEALLFVRPIALRRPKI